jgi:EmrB/QacA subfamily drug resistance transporter
MLVPAGQIMLARAAGPSRMGRVMSTVGIAVVLAPVIGPVAGGLLIAVSWRWLFLINVPVGLAGLLAGRRVLPVDGERQPAGRLDVPGLLLAAGGLALLTYGITDASRRGSVTLLPVALTVVGGAAALVLFVLRSRAIPAPLVQLSLWRNRAFTTSAIVAFFGGAALFGGLVIVPLYFELLRGQGTVATGLLLIGQGVGAAVTMPLSGRLTDRFGGGLVSVAGLFVSAVATLPLLAVTAHTGLAAVVAITTARGMGIGLAIMPAIAAAYSAISPAQIADATPQLNAVQRIGGSIGTAVLVVAVQRGISQPTHAFHLSFALLLAATLLGLVPAVMLTWALRRTERTP